MSKPKLRVYNPGAFDWSPYFDVVSVKNYKDAEFVGHNGGSDITPSIYGHKNSRSHCYNGSEQRDRAEIAMMEYCIKHGIPQFGNCRSHQMLNIINGGTMIQHVSHGSSHIVTTYDGQEVLTNSIHHQMICPYITQTGVDKCNIDILGWTDISHTHIGQEGTEIEFPEGAVKEIEIAHFPDLNAFGIQAHVDFGGNYSALYAFLYKEMLARLKFL